MDAENAADKPPGLGTMLLNTAVETGKEFSGYNDAGKAIDAAKRGDWKSALAHGLMAAPTPLGKVGKAGKIRKAIKGQPTRGKKLPNDEILPPPKRGDAPISKKDGKPIEMHHRDQKPDDPVDEMHPSDHRYGENYQKNHPNTGQKKSKIDRAEFRKWQQRIRREDWDSGRFEQDEEDGQK
jgi:hypothetical protein